MISEQNNQQFVPILRKTRTTNCMIVMCVISFLFVFFSLCTQSTFAPLAEDAFITFRNVENLLAGNGLVFNKFEQTETLSNILWALWLAFLVKLNLPLLFSAAVSGMFFSLLTIWLLWFFSKRKLKRSGYFQFIAALLTATHTYVAMHSNNGLETSLYMFLITATSLMTVVESENKKLFPFSAILISLASITRPEAPLLFVVIMLLKVISDIRGKKIQASTIYFFCTFTVIYGVFFLFRVFYYHDICPNTVYARLSSFSSLNKAFAFYVKYIKEVKGYIIFAPILFLFFRKDILRKTSLVLPIVLVFIVLLLFSAGPVHSSRYMIPVIPLLFLFVQEGLYSLSCFSFMNGYKKFKYFSVSALVLLILMLNLLAHNTGSSNYRDNPMVKSLKTFAANPSIFYDNFLMLYNLKDTVPKSFQAMFGDWIRKNLPPKSTIVYDQMGQTPYYAGIGYTFIDSWGLTDKTVTQIVRKDNNLFLKKIRGVVVNDIFNLQTFDPDFSQTFTEYILSRNPDYVFILARTKQIKELLASELFNRKYSEFFPETPNKDFRTAYRKKYP